jgi:hypothetical protein
MALSERGIKSPQQRTIFTWNHGHCSANLSKLAGVLSPT